MRAIRNDSLLRLFSLSIIPAIYSSILLCLSYPFIGSTDGWSRWMTALIIADGVNLPGYFWSDIFPPLLSILLAVSNMLSGEYGYFTFMQIFVVCFALSLVVWKSLPEDWLTAKWIVYAVCLTLLLANPFVLNRLAQVYPEPLLTVGLLMLSLLLYKARDMSIPTFTSLSLLTILISIGLRYNAMALTIPLLLIATARAFPGGSLNRLLSVATLIILASFCVYKLPTLLGMNKSHNLAYIVAWDYIGTILNTASPAQEYSLHDLLSFEEAVALYDRRSNDSLQWGPNKIQPSLIAEHSGKIYREFVSLIAAHPIAFAELRLYRLANLCTLADLPELDGPYEAPIYSDWGSGGPVDINYQPVIPGLRHWLVKLYYHEGHHWLFKPPFVVLMAIAFVSLLKYFRLPFRLEAWMVLVAVLYYLTFALVTPKVSYRFFFPSYLVLMTVNYVAFGKLFLLTMTHPPVSEKS